MCYLIRSKRLKLLIAASTILALLFIVMYLPNIRHCVVWWAYSPSLPSNAPYFTGRDQEVDELIRWLDLEDNEIGAISITGPPGIGKSSLAVQVAHAMIDRGAVVSYVDADMVPADDLPEKILCSAGVTAQNYSYERLLKWVKREMKYPLVVIIDNCDFLAHSERDRFQALLYKVVENAATTVKIIATSRQMLDQLKQFRLQEIDSEASCGLLRAMLNRHIDAVTCKSIVTLTGNIPMSLKLVGAILKSRTTNYDVEKVVASLTREFTPTLSFEDIPHEKRVNASVSVSLKYLKHNLITLGQHLSLFPGPFSVTDACSVLSGSLNERCNHLQADIDALRDRSLLQQCGQKHYKFSDIIKSIFVNSNSGQNIDVGPFLVHYAAKLRALSAQFERNDIPVLCTLEKEKQNIRYFVKHICDWCELDISLSVQLFEALKVSFETEVLAVCLAESEIRHLLTKSVTCLEQIMQTGSSRSDQEVTNLISRALHIYIYIILHTPVRGPENAIPVFERAQLWVDKMSEVATLSDIEAFYYKLALHYSALGRLEDDARCHVKVLVKANELQNCDNDTRDYSAIARAFYRLKNYEVSAHYLQLQLQEQELSTIQQANDLLALHNCQTKVGNYSEARNTARQLLGLSSQLTGTNTSDIYANLDLYSKIESTFWSYNWTDEARYIEHKLVTVVKEISGNDHQTHEGCYQVFELVKSLFRTKQYAILPEIAHSALDLCTIGCDDQNVHVHVNEIAELHFLLGMAEFYNHNTNKSLSSLKMLLDYRYTHYTQFVKDACKTMLLQGHIEVACFLLVLEEAKNVTYFTIVFIFAHTFHIDEVTNSQDQPSVGSSPNTYFLSSQLAADAPLYAFYILFIFEKCVHLIRFLFSVRCALCLINYFCIFLKLWMSYHFLYYTCYVVYRCLVFIRRICDGLRKIYSDVFIAFV